MDEHKDFAVRGAPVEGGGTLFRRPSHKIMHQFAVDRLADEPDGVKGSLRDDMEKDSCQGS